MIDSQLLSLRKHFTADNWINLHAADHCNLLCTYCYYNNRTKALPSYDINYILEVIKKSKKPVTICFYGGEPCLNIPFMGEVIKKAKTIRQDVNFTIQTNGTLITKVPMGMLNEFYSIAISIDGGKEVMEKVRGKDVFDNVLSNLKTINSYYINPIMARMTLTEDNDIFKDITCLMENFDYVYWQIDNDLWKRDHSDFQRRYMKDMESLFSYWTDQLQKGSSNILVPFYGIYLLLRTTLPHDKYYYHCVPGCGSVTIDAKGNIFSCPEGVSRSSMNDDCFIGSITSKENIYINKHSPKKECISCDVNYICGGRCMWTHELLYCKCSRKIIDIVSKNMEIISNNISKERIIDIMSIIFNTEIMP